MPRAASARRYAQAVYQIATERNELYGWFDDLAVLADTLESSEFAEVLDTPQVSAIQKADLINNIVGDRVSPLARNLISLLASRSIAHILPGIAEQYERLLDAHRGIERGEVLSAVSLDEKQRREIAALLGGIVGKETRLTSRVEPQILGGVVARVGDHLIDGSTRTKLRDMRRQLAE